MAKTQAECDLESPDEMFAWAFAAGVPDPRDPEGKKFPPLPLINPNCFAGFSRMLYEMGFRFHPELQKLWVKPSSGPTRNFEAWGATDVAPDVAAMVVEQFPEVARDIAAVTPTNQKQKLEEQAVRLLESVARLKEARDRMAKEKGASPDTEAATAVVDAITAAAAAASASGVTAEVPDGGAT